MRETVRELGEHRATGFLKKFYGWYLGRGRFPRPFKQELVMLPTIAEVELRLLAAAPGARFVLERCSSRGARPGGRGAARLAADLDLRRRLAPRIRPRCARRRLGESALGSWSASTGEARARGERQPANHVRTWFQRGSNDDPARFERGREVTVTRPSRPCHEVDELSAPRRSNFACGGEGCRRLTR